MNDKPFEVWVSHETLIKMLRDHDFPERHMRFNARFDSKERARAEIIWYKDHGYHAELVMYGVYIEDDVFIDEDEPYDGVLEYPEGSGG